MSLLTSVYEDLYQLYGLSVLQLGDRVNMDGKKRTGSSSACFYGGTGITTQYFIMAVTPVSYRASTNRYWLAWLSLSSVD
jgi:hypothetical protein